MVTNLVTILGSSGGYAATAVVYASFPVANPGSLSSIGMVCSSVVYSGTANWSAVSETTEDGATSYVYNNVVNNADLYTIASIPVTPASIVCVTARAFAQKSDAGSRTGALQLKSGATTVQAPNGQTLSTPWAWMWGTYLNDPATSAAWTASAVNNVQIGPIVLT
jgi:hypothetical protein